MNLLGKVDRFPFFLLEVAHAECAGAITQHIGDGLVADIYRRDNPCSGTLSA